MRTLLPVLTVVALAPTLLAQAKEVRIACVGDSITEGYNGPLMLGRPSYRLDLWQLLQTNHHLADFVGPRTGREGDVTPNPAAFDQDHCATSGHTSYDAWQALLGASFVADVALVHLGTNDVILANSSPVFLPNVITRLQAMNPQIVILLAKLIPIAGYSVTTANTYIQGLAGPGVHIVDMNSGYSVGWNPDGVHPGPQGELFLANQWSSALTLHGLLPPVSATDAAYWDVGRGCRPAVTPPQKGVPRLAVTRTPSGPVLPKLGTLFAVDLTSLPPSSAVFSTVNFTLQAAPLAHREPCFTFPQLAGASVFTSGVTTANGTMVWSFNVPSSPSFAGVDQVWQAAAFDSVANEWAVTNAAIVRAGN
jgi:lysophospholipase L1-like esterase